MSTNRYKEYHVVPNPRKAGSWRVEGQNARRPSSWHDTKEEAVRRGRELAHRRKGQLLVHTTGGLIQTEYTYGKDPFPPRG